MVALTSIEFRARYALVRAKAIQPYDVGPGGRFWFQQLALAQILEHPNGLGPFEFARIFGGQQHDVYMQGFLVYGWLGGAAYMTLVLVTLVIGIRAVLISTPWQYYLIAAYAAFVGEAGRGLHRRHRPLASFFSSARHDLGTDRGHDQFLPPAGLLPSAPMPAGFAACCAVTAWWRQLHRVSQCMHILINDFIGGALDRGIPLYVRNLIDGLRGEGLRVECGARTGLLPQAAARRALSDRGRGRTDAAAGDRLVAAGGPYDLSVQFSRCH